MVFMFSAALIHDGRYAAAAVLFALLSAAVFFCVSFQAAAMHRRLLGILYTFMRPDDFISVYAQLPEKKHIRANIRFSMMAYLSNGYAAGGRFEQALAVLDKMPPLPPHRQEEGEAILAGNRCDIFLAMGNLTSAQAQYDKLMACVARGIGTQNEIAQLLNIKLRLAHDNVKDQDADYVRQLIKKDSSAFYKANMKLLVGQIYVALGELDFARSYLTEVAQGDKQMWIVGHAAAILEQI